MRQALNRPGQFEGRCDDKLSFRGFSLCAIGCATGLPPLRRLFFFAMASAAFAQQDYKTPQDAVDALVAAARSGDQKALLFVLGPGGEDIVSSGDKVADEATRKHFVESYDAKHAIAMKGEHKAILIVGDSDYPFPIPLERVKGGMWSFDTEEGRNEILYRRIGRNELDAIQTCLAYVDAQIEYAEKDRTGAGVGVYAQRFISSRAKRMASIGPRPRARKRARSASYSPTLRAKDIRPNKADHRITATITRSSPNRVPRRLAAL